MKPLEDYSFVRGVNYAFKPLEKADEIRRDLGYGKRIGLNSVRIWLSYHDYFNNPAAYAERLKGYVSLCHECGYSVMPIIWNGNMLDPAILEAEFRDKAEAYVACVADALKDEEGLLIYDIMNEPTCNGYIGEEVSPEEHETRLEKLWEHIRFSYNVLRKHDSINATTVGHTLIYDAEPTIDCVDVISFHDYSNTSKSIDNQFKKAVELSEKYEKPYMNTETGCIARGNPYDMALSYCQNYNVGYYIFELMIEGYWKEIHGIFYPDGTVRDPGIVAAIMGCYRKRDDGIVLANIDRENFARKAVDDIAEALKDKTADAFAYERGSLDKLLTACESAAYLLESAELVPMAYPPTAKLAKFRKDKHPDVNEIRKFAYDLAMTIKKNALII